MRSGLVFVVFSKGKTFILPDLTLHLIKNMSSKLANDLAKSCLARGLAKNKARLSLSFHCKKFLVAGRFFRAVFPLQSTPPSSFYQLDGARR
jgi:hypothetical protein